MHMTVGKKKFTLTFISVPRAWNEVSNGHAGPFSFMPTVLRVVPFLLVMCFVMPVAAHLQPSFVGKK